MPTKKRFANCLIIKAIKADCSDEPCNLVRVCEPRHNRASFPDSLEICGLDLYVK